MAGETGLVVRTTMALLVATLITAAAVSAQRTPAGVRPLASVRQLHDLMITPASDVVFRAGGETPTTPGAWLDVRNQALLLAESGNLLMLDGRALDTAGWMTISRALVDAAASAASAAEKHDADALGEAGDAITAACESCHQPYRDRGRQMLGR